MKKILPLLIILSLSAASIRAQENKLLTDMNQYGREVSVVPLRAESQDGFLVLQNRRANYRVWFDIRVQTDGAMFWRVPDNFNPIGNGVSIRRARFAVKGQLRRDWYGELDLDFANGILELKDALMRYDGINNLQLQVGNFKENFSMQVNTTSRYLQFIERPMATAFAPSRHIGFQAKYSVPLFWAAAGVFWQPVEDSEVRTNIEDNNKDYGRGPGHTFTGKVVFRPLYNMEDASLHIGLAASFRTKQADVAPTKYGTVRISARNSTSINRKKYLDTGNIADFNNEMMYTAELAGHWRGLRWESAYLADNVHVDKSAANNKSKLFYGVYAQAGYLLFGGSQHYDEGGAKYTRVTTGRDWGDIEICGRYDRLDLDSEGVYGGAANGWTLGVNYWINSNIKIMVNYQYVKNNKYANGNGKLYVGYDSAGAPTTDPSAVDSSKGDVGVGYNMLACRFEINF